MKTRYRDIEPYVTRDGSLIRELMHPALHGASHGVRHQSLAEATVPVGTRTVLHRHARSEELYFVLAGQGRMCLGEAVFDVAEGDALCIPPGVAHCIENTGQQGLRILCCCAPAYSHRDTELLEATGSPDQSTQMRGSGNE